MAYATADEVREWLGLVDMGLDGLFDRAIPAAEEWVNAYCGRTFEAATTATARYYDVDPRSGVVYVDEISDASSVIVNADYAYNGTWSTLWSATDYQLLPLSPSYETWPYTQIAPTGTRSFPAPIGTRYFPRVTYRRGLIKVTAKWGWPAIPAKVRLAAIMQAARLVNRRSSPNGVAGFNDLGVVRVSATDRDVEALLADFRAVGIA